jgi:8-oxo-dGTP diphosphatase
VSGAPPKRIRVVAALIADASGERYLVQQRPVGKSRPMLWEFPGGKVEAAEGDVTALIRECQEELGVELIVGRYLWKNEHAYTDVTVELVLYSAQILHGTPEAKLAQQVQYMSPAEMKAVSFCEADLPFLEALAQGRVGRLE